MENLALNSAFFYSLGMTLLHSLWQILAVYVILRMVLSLLKGSNAVSRYIISVFSLVFILGMAVFTFSVYQNNEDPDNSVIYYQLVRTMDEGPDDIISYPVPEPSDNIVIESNSDFEYLPWFVLAYIAGILLLSIRLITGILFLRKYRIRGILPMEPELEVLFENLISRIKLKRKVNILQSALTQVPFVIGYFKPVVIVPVGILTQLPFNQVEAILAHELAHVRRNDFIMNLLQSLIELLFFYHPAIYLISGHIRKEREHCCDDIAIQICPDTTQYAKALASMEEFRINITYPAVAFVKKKNNLLERIKRILKPNLMKTKISDRIFAGLIILLGLSTILITGAAAINNFSPDSFPDNSEGTSIQLKNLYGNTPLEDTIIDFDNGRIITQHKAENGQIQKIEMVFLEEELSQLIVDGKEIPGENYVDYKDIVKSTLINIKDIREELKESEKELARIEEEHFQELMIDSFPDRELIMAEVQEAIAEAERELSGIQMEEIRAEIEDAIAEIDAAQIREEVNSALEEVNWEEIHEEIAKAMEEVEIELNGVDVEVAAALNEIDWGEIRMEIEEAMKEAEISNAEIAEAMEGLEEIDWELINESVKLGLEAAALSMEGLDEIIEGSVGMGLEIATEILESLDETIFNDSETDRESIVEGVKKAREEVEEEDRKLDSLEESMEKTLEKLENETSGSKKDKRK